MNCPHCANEIADDSKFCNYCGMPPQAKPKEDQSKLVLIVMLGLVAAIAVGAAFYFWNQTQQAADSNSRSAPKTAHGAPAREPAPVFIPVTKTLVAGQVTVKPASDLRWKLEIDTAKMHNPVVSGSFRASGGTGNDIQVVVADEDNFENWINGHTADVIFATDKTTNGKIYVPITQTGTYYLSFNNRFSVFTEKQVFADVTLSYQVQQ